MPIAAHVVECLGCGLWFQSPRLPRQRQGELYPSEYAPHTETRAGAPSLHPALLAYLARRRGYGHLKPAPGAVARLLAEAGLPDGVISLVHGGPATGEALVRSSIDGVAFTGSAEVGREIARRLSEGPFSKPVLA